MLPKYNRRSQYTYVFILAIFMIIGFSIATFKDLNITQALYKPTNFLAIFMEAIGWIPSYLPFAVLAILISKRHSRSMSTWLRIACLIFYLVFSIGISVYAISKFSKRELFSVSFNAGFIITILLLIIFFAAFFLLVWRTPEAQGAKLRFFALCGCGLMIITTLLSQILERIWGRMRFDEMMKLGSFADFTPWYKILNNMSDSFPSGHTIAACGIVVLVILCDLFPQWNRKRIGVWVACWAYIIIMAVSRLIIGRHFLSDTLAGMIIYMSLFCALRHSKMYRRQVAKLRRRRGARPAQPNLAG